MFLEISAKLLIVIEIWPEMLEEKEQLDDLQFADEEKLRHEITYLSDRLKNLEVFKKMFFTLQEDLVEERRKFSELESQLNSSSDVESPAAQLDDTGDTQTVENIDSLKEELQSANNMAMLSMTTAGEYSAIIDFFRDSGSASDYESMVKMLFAAGSSYGCGISVEIRCNNDELVFSYDENVKDEQAAIITRLKLQGRLIEENGLICINYKKISLLISNLPQDDIEKYGRIKDNLVVLASGANSIVDSIDSKIKLTNERKNLYKIVKGTHHAMENISKGIGDQIRKTNAVQNAFIKGLVEAIAHSKLDEVEKKKLNSMLASGKKSLSKVLMESFVLDENFVEVISKLEKTYSVVDSTDNKTQTQSAKQPAVQVEDLPDI
ncbi:MAG: hypothetical protein DIZ80_14225 [endosymbiont of Galathealinum brachiosum]|uniref:Uncharacterized protein n=1 Tax=endosymbiont of Galathealinum brachiosum TaxID=2200906 RepID=A0A370D8N8_9GAMM|nr:MAG: hypothetical protein DIZ80_14225 [endosymbiont of Galathealinum brachiosum]